MSHMGHSRPTHSAPAPINVRYASNSDRSRHESELARSAKSGLPRIFCSQVLIAWRDPARDDFGDLKIVASSSRAQAFHDAHPILYLAILAHLPLAFEPRDSKPKSHNSAQYNFNVCGWRIRWRPWLGFAAFLLSGKFSHMLEQPVLVFHNFGVPVGMNDRKVPRRHGLSMLGFGGIPVWCDVTLGPLEDHQRLVALDKLLPMRIRTREVAFDDPAGSLVLEHGGQVAGIQTGRAGRNECSKRASTHQRM